MTNLATGATLPRRLPGIDVLRGIAAGAVALAHIAQTALPETFARWGLAWTGLGAYGVGLFFVISGFCIHAPMVRQEMAGGGSGLDHRAFYRRRFVRLYPAHVVALALSIGAAALVAAPPGFSTLVSVTTPGQLGLHLLMVHTFSPTAIYTGNSVLWTLAIETHFYLAYPLFLALRRRFGAARVCAGLFVASAALTAVSGRLPEPWGLLYVSAPFRWWEWVLGCVVVEAVLSRRPRVTPGLGAVVAAALASAAVGLGMMHVHGSRARGLVWPLLFAIVILLASWMRPPRPGILSRVLLAMGQASYSLYLVHPIAYHLAVAALVALGAGLPARAAGVALAGAALTWAFYAGVERPSMARAVAAGSAPSVPAGAVPSALRVQ
jgi:peptidoglycan/LPS O-acetylase OafA/YrhL